MICFCSSDGVCSEELTSFMDLVDNEIDKQCFPGVNSMVLILLLRDDRFFESRISLRSTYVCSFHKQRLLKEYWLSAHGKCWLCTRTRTGKSTSVRYEYVFFWYRCLNTSTILECSRSIHQSTSSPGRLWKAECSPFVWKNDLSSLSFSSRWT